MALVRWDPFSDIDTLFNRTMPRMLATWSRAALPAEAADRAEWSLSTDISETDTEYLIRAELPAVRKEDVKVTVEAGMLTIEGERKHSKEANGERLHRAERFYGRFMRQFSLPENAQADAVRCESADGVLTVHVPKKTLEKRKPIEIKVQ
ncbi:MAG TPA: Hsp20/alpha crystallin family protein [Steroidobacteraceae bacterium]|nr:Hsp20/alpha crystallin family protein [Steroidobacteraceae bacterium]